MKMNKIFKYGTKTRLLSTTIGFVCLVLQYSCAPKPPFEKGKFKNSDLVELTKLDSTILWTFFVPFRFIVHNLTVSYVKNSFLYL
jgi:hypothetical protein